MNCHVCCHGKQFYGTTCMNWLSMDRNILKLISIHFTMFFPNFLHFFAVRRREMWRKARPWMQLCGPRLSAMEASLDVMVGCLWMFMDDFSPLDIELLAIGNMFYFKLKKSCLREFGAFSWLWSIIFNHDCADDSATRISTRFFLF